MHPARQFATRETCSLTSKPSFGVAALHLAKETRPANGNRQLTLCQLMTVRPRLSLLRLTGIPIQTSTMQDYRALSHPISQAWLASPVPDNRPPTTRGQQPSPACRAARQELWTPRAAPKP